MERFLGQDNTVRMSEYAEPISACDCDQRDTGLIGGLDRKCCGCRNGNHHRCPSCRCLLHHLYRYPAGQNDRALSGQQTAGCDCSYELVEGIVPANVFPDEGNARRGLPKRCRVYGSSLLVQDLQRSKRPHRLDDVNCAEPATARHSCRFPPRLLEALEPAKSTTHGPTHRPAPRSKSSRTVTFKPHLDLDTEIALNDFDAHNITDTVDEALGERETQAEVAEIGGRRHHDCMSRAIVAERNRGLFGNEASCRDGTITSPVDLIMDRSG